MLMIQTELWHPIPSGVRKMIVWLPQHPRVHEGSIISLHHEIQLWRVMKQYTPMDSEQIQRGWGLDLPKSTRTER